MLYLIFAILSVFYPDERPNCLTNTYCPDSIKPTLTSILPKQYCGCQYPNSKVKIDESIQNIPSYAFYGSTIQELKLHPCIQSINEGAFGNCSIKLDLSEAINLKIIGDGSFYQAKISPNIIFPNTIEIIGSYAFANSTSLQKVIIRSKIIKSNAFLGCYNMICETIEIFGSGFIYDDAFHDCYQLNGTLIIHEAIDRNKEGQLIYSTIGQSSFQNSGIRKIEIPQIKSILSKSFYNCSQLTRCSSINIETIERSAFENDFNLQIESITAKFIDCEAFYNCHRLQPKITYIDSKRPHDSIPFKKCEHNDQNRKKKLTRSQTSGKCGDNIEYKIEFLFSLYALRIRGSGEMYNYTSFESPWIDYQDLIEEVDVTSGVTAIGDYAFYRFSNLVRVSLPSCLISIGEDSFRSCYKLTSINFPSGFTTIGDSSFSYCEKLRTAYLPASLSYIGGFSFHEKIL